MSFDIFLLAADGETFERAIVERAFAGCSIEREPDSWDLVGPHYVVSVDVVDGSAEPLITGLAINRPPFVPEFWDAMFEILRQTRSYLVWPALGRPSYCVANPDWVSYITADYIAGFGPPRLVSSAAEIPGAIDASFD